MVVIGSVRVSIGKVEQLRVLKGGDKDMQKLGSVQAGLNLRRNRRQLD